MDGDQTGDADGGGPGPADGGDERCTEPTSKSSDSPAASNDDQPTSGTDPDEPDRPDGGVTNWLDRRDGAGDTGAGDSGAGDSGAGDTGAADLEAAFADEHWVEAHTVEDGTVKLRASGAPDLRSVYDVIRAEASGDGAVFVLGDGQEWRVGYEDGSVVDVEREGSEYTARRMTLGQRLVSAVSFGGAYVGIGALITAVASVFMTTPVTAIEGLGVAVVGLVVFLVSNAFNGVWEEVTGGAVAEQPGGDLPGFDALPETDRAALVAIDDEKSSRNLGALVGQYRLSPRLLNVGLVVYVMVLGYVNYGGAGVLAAGLLFSLRPAAGVALAALLAAGLEEASSPRAKTSFEAVHEAVGGATKPRLLEYGDSDNPVHENCAMAIPELDVIVLPKADVEKFHDDELRATIAHEYRHVQSHSPMVLTLVKVGLLLAPGIVLLATGATPAIRPLAGALYAALVVGLAVLALVRRRWESQADETAAGVGSPLGMAFALTRLTDRHVVDAEGQSLLTGASGQLYGSHPYPRRRVGRLLARIDGD